VLVLLNNSVSLPVRTGARKFSIGGALGLSGGLNIEKLTKTQLIIVFHVSIWGGLELCPGG